MHAHTCDVYATEAFFMHRLSNKVPTRQLLHVAQLTVKLDMRAWQGHSIDGTLHTAAAQVPCCTQRVWQGLSQLLSTSLQLWQELLAMHAAILQLEHSACCPHFI